MITRQSMFALALLHFAVDPTAYELQVGKPFDRWNWPVTEIEWDFGEYLGYYLAKSTYSKGGESKSANILFSSLRVWLTHSLSVGKTYGDAPEFLGFKQPGTTSRGIRLFNAY